MLLYIYITIFILLDIYIYYNIYIYILLYIVIYIYIYILLYITIYKYYYVVLYITIYKYQSSNPSSFFPQAFSIRQASSGVKAYAWTLGRLEGHGRCSQTTWMT